MVDHISDSDDESIDEDMAFNSDDERQYGSVFAGAKGGDSDSDTASNSSDDEKSYSGDEDSDGIASDDDDDEGDGGQFMLDLLNNLDKKNDDEKKQKEEARKEMAHSKLMTESEYSSAVKSSNLTLDQLMSNIADTKGFGAVQKTMKGMSSDTHDEEKRLTTTSAPVAKVVSSRAERKVNYEEQKNEISQWTTATKQNREAETLDFRPKDRIKITKDELVGKFQPTTDFEKEMADALEEAGVTDEGKMENMDDAMFRDDDEDDDLGRNTLSEEDYRKRHGELAKMRALMFYEEQKRHRINKIKSKKYRKIRKKQRMRMKDAEESEAAEQDDEYAKELEEKAELERMKERMSLKHRNTSKWAKRVLRRGKNVDMDTRRALSEQVRIGDELKRKMQGHFSDDSEDEETDLLGKARAILAETEEDAHEEKKKGLFSMDFMKKGLEAQRERAKQEARELLNELEANVDASDDEGQDTELTETDNSQKKKPKVASAKEMEKILSKGKLTATSLEFGNSNTVEVGGEIDLNIGSASTRKSNAGNATTIVLSQVEADEDGEQKEKNRSKVRRQVKTNQSNHVEEEGSNPWVRNASKENNTEDRKGSKKLKKNLPRISKQGIVNVADAVSILSGDVDADDDRRKIDDAQAASKENASSTIASLTQEELVKKAFATPLERDIEEDFEKEKDTMREREDPSKKKEEENKTVSGWGSWAGEGAPPPRPPRKIPKHLAPPEKKKEKRRRMDDGKKNVIISAKRVKKSAKFQMENVPYPYSSREQYDRAMAGSIGAEWNVSGAVKNFTRADVVTRAGKIIRPISKKAKVKRAPLAKFK